MIENVTIGADPELFLEKDGQIISAEGLIGGTKHEPLAISEEGHFIQEDNVMAEFNIPPCATAEEMIYNIGFVKDYLEILASMNGAKLNYSASAMLAPEFLNTPQAKEFGCMPDYNVYKKSTNPSPKKNTKLRSCGGHIHIGFKDPDQKSSEDVVLAMDAVLGLKSLFIDTDDRRREMYGKAGSFRFKSFGVEYRTLSNFWIATDELIKWAFDNTIKAIELVNSGGIEQIKSFSTDIETAINENNKELATVLLEKISKINAENLKAA